MNDAVRDIVTAVLMLVAAVMCFAAGVGVIRFPDVLSRLHAATKPQILGLIAVTANIAVNDFSLGTVTLVVAIVAFQLLTAPMAAHLVARAAYTRGHPRPDLLFVDEFAPAYRQSPRGD